MRRFLLIGVTALLASCHGSRKVQGGMRNLDTLTVRAFNDPRKQYRGSAPIEWRFRKTDVSLSFDYKARTAQGKAILEMAPFFTVPDSMVLDAKSMKIDAVSINGHPAAYRYDSLQLHIHTASFRNDSLLRVEIAYTAMPYAGSSKGSEAITDDRGLYFINTDNAKPGMPVQIWTQGETEANSHWMPTIDKPNMRTPVRLSLTVPDRYVTLSNGRMVSSHKRDSLRTDIWETPEPIQVYAVMFAIGDFAIVKDKWEDKEVNYYVEPAYEPYARMMFRNTPEMIGFFSGITGVRFPWEKYHQIVVREYVSGAMENTSASLFGEFMNQDKRQYEDENHEDVVSHELFHQWFGDLVTAESWSNLTVNESFANYGEYLWREYKYGRDYADRLANSDLQRYLNGASYSDPALVRFYYGDKEEMFDHISYQKGGAILHYLHYLLGNEKFSKAMQYYLTRNRLQSAEAVHWRLAVEEADGRDWNWFFDQWYLRGGHPELTIQYTYNDAAQRMLVTVNQKAPAYHLPTDVKWVSGTGTRMLHWDLKQLKDTFSYAYENGQPPLLIIDAPHVLPAAISDQKTSAMWLRQMQSGGDYLTEYNALRSGAKLINSADARKIMNLGLESRYAGIRQSAVELLSRIEAEAARKEWIEALRHIAVQDNNNLVRAAAIELLGKWKERSIIPSLREAVNDSSYMVAGNAVYALYELKDSLAYGLAKQHINAKPNTNLYSKSWLVIAESAHAEDTALFLRSEKDFYEANKSLIYLELLYAENISSVAAFTATMNMLEKAIPDQSVKSFREYYAGKLKEIAESLSSPKARKEPLNNVKLDALKRSVTIMRDYEQDKEVRDVYNSILR
ncbi:M1 family metallopeptidase [Rurimicrobium arvi]|uniref:Aminopeptidase N n=1 Tax=Rurimicrobium arvi TaxID=2049916 RepID=A0ABP8N1Q8_9BACT